MPTVPRLDSPQVRQVGLPGDRINPAADLEAFGGGQSKQALATAGQNVLGSFASIAKDEADKANQVAHMDASTKIGDLETNLQTETFNYKGKDAAAAPDVINQKWKDGIAKVRESLNNDTQREAFDLDASQRWQSLNKHVQLYVYDQKDKFDDQTTAGYIDQSKNAAVLNAGDDQRVGIELERQREAVQEWAKRKGLAGSDVEKQKLSDVLSATHDGVITSRLESGDISGAKSYFDQNRQGMSSDELTKVQKQIDDKETLSQGMAAYDQVKTLKLGDGTPDENKMRSQIFASDLPDVKKEKIWDYVKARAGEDLANKNKSDASNERSFMNQALQTRQKGLPMDEALKLVDRYGVDSYDKTLKTQAVQAIYAPPKNSDEIVKYNLWEGIQNGTTSSADIDKAMTDQKLSASDWATTKQEYYKAAVEGRSPEMKYTNERIKELATQQFGSDKQRESEYLNTVNSETINLSPEQKYKKAQDLLQKDANTQHNFFGLFKFGGDDQYKTDLNVRDASTLAFGKAKEDLGPETVKAIGQGVLSKKNNFSPGDLDAFSIQLGGYSQIKPGTPNYDAMQWLMKKGMPVVPENVKAVVQRRQVSTK